MSNCYSSRCINAIPPLTSHNNAPHVPHILAPNELSRCEHPPPIHQPVYFIPPNFINNNHVGNIRPPFNVSSSFGEETNFQYGSSPATFNPEANEFHPTQLQKQLWFYTIPTTTTSPPQQQHHQANQSFFTNHCSSSIPIDNQYPQQLQHPQQNFNLNLIHTNQNPVYCTEQMVMMNHEMNAPPQLQPHVPQPFLPVQYVPNQSLCPRTAHWMSGHPEPGMNCPAMVHQQQTIILNNNNNNNHHHNLNNNNNNHHHNLPPPLPPSHFHQTEFNKKREGTMHNGHHNSFSNYKSRPSHYYNHNRIMTNRVKTETVILSPPNKIFHPNNNDPTLNVNAQEFYPLFPNTNEKQKLDNNSNVSESDQNDYENNNEETGKKKNQHTTTPTPQNHRITRGNQQLSHEPRKRSQILEQTWESLAKQEHDQSYKLGQN